MREDYEKLGWFYLGQPYDLGTGKRGPGDTLYDSKDLTTHAVIVGMTGSGKTGLGIALLEEAAIDNIPALIIDPKGDMGNLMLTFPQLRPADFQPWIEKDEALRRGQTVEQCAAERASQWKKGLEDWDQPIERIASFRDKTEVAIFTPGSDAGIPLTILKSLNAPPPAVLSSMEVLRERISATVSGLLTLLGIEADPLRSREHILLSNILDQAWQAGRNLDLGQLIREIQKPSFSRIGVMDLESIFPAADRMGLAMTINNVLASPGFSSWTTGQPLDIQKLLYTPEGKPRLAILSIAHLGEKERMFFVTLLLNEVVAWMRSQPGTSSLRAILYMDEMFGYLPPTANPPSKIPMLTLLKQARAYGLGLVLATQNPVDLDYKALSNAGTWFLGRLQTERDKARILDGLEGASASAGATFDRQRTEAVLSGLGNRVFLMNNVHANAPVVFQTRWALSYLRGPLTREQIRSLMAGSTSRSEIPESAGPSAAAAGLSAGGESTAPPVIAPEIPQRHVAVSRNIGRDAKVTYLPALFAKARVHYVDAKSRLDHWRDMGLLVDLDAEVPKDPWEEALKVNLDELRTTEAEADAGWGDVPAECQRASSYKTWGSALKSYLQRACPLTISSCPDLKLFASPEEREGDFKSRIAHLAREERDLQVEKIRAKFADKAARLEDRKRRAEQKTEQEKQQANSASMSAAMTFGASVLGALFGKKKLSATNVNRAATSMRAAGRASDQRSDIKRAEENVEKLAEDIAALEEQVQAEIDKVSAAYSESELEIETVEIAPRKSDLAVEEVALLWLPYITDDRGRRQPAYNEELRLAE